ncbi:MAG: methyltransferase family protein [Nitrospinales bacterium]
MIDFKSLSSNQRFLLSVFVPSLYFFPLAVAYFSPKTFGFGYPRLVPIALAIGAAGCGIWILGMFSLGKSLAVLPGGETLKTGGIYRYLRHPVYVGINLTLFGLLAACGSIFGMAYLAIVVIPLNRYRAREEEKALLEKFGDNYRAYREKTWF